MDAVLEIYNKNMKQKFPTVAFTDLLHRWGAWCQYPCRKLGYPTYTREYRWMGGWDLKPDDDFEVVQLDRQISQLPIQLRRVLIAHYVLGGTVPQKVSASGLSRSVYYRVLGQAHVIVSANQT